MRKSRSPKDDNTPTAAIPKTQEVFGLFHAKKPIAKKTIKLAYKARIVRKFQTSSEVKEI